MACGCLRFATMTSMLMGFRRRIKDNKVKGVIFGVNLVV
jgi:hypothetical protein